jgi:ABC-type multidrug transport system ATPase subunit
LIQQSLSALEHELTLFIVAHRMSTLDICDRVMIIIDGKLVAFDTISYLQEHNHYYRTATQMTNWEQAVAHSAAGSIAPKLEVGKLDVAQSAGAEPTGALP